VQGMLNTTNEVITNAGIMMSLWKHECTRVIADRFTEMNDKEWFEKTLKAVSTLKRTIHVK
jgi:dynein heavy chain